MTSPRYFLLLLLAAAPLSACGPRLVATIPIPATTYDDPNPPSRFCCEGPDQGSRSTVIVRFLDGGKPIVAKPFVHRLLQPVPSLHGVLKYSPRYSFQFGTLAALAASELGRYEDAEQFAFTYAYHGQTMTLIGPAYQLYAGGCYIDSLPFKPGIYQLRVAYKLGRLADAESRLDSNAIRTHLQLATFQQYFQRNQHQLRRNNPFAGMSCLHIELSDSGYSKEVPSTADSYIQYQLNRSYLAYRVTSLTKL